MFISILVRSLMDLTEGGGWYFINNFSFHVRYCTTTCKVGYCTTCEVGYSTTCEVGHDTSCDVRAVVPVNVPVPQVPVGGVLDVPDVGAHDLPGDVLLGLDASLQHGHLKLTQHLHRE